MNASATHPRALRIWACVVPLALLALCWPRAAQAEPALLQLSAGQVGIQDSLRKPTRLGVAYRFAPIRGSRFRPAIGVAGAGGGARYSYAELRYEWWLAPRWVLAPSFAAGVFSEGDELRLGHELEFRSGLELAWRFWDHYRVGIAGYHLSNGGVGRINPGTEAIVASLSLPLAGPRRRGLRPAARPSPGASAPDAAAP